MKDLVIIAAGGCGREVLQIAKDINKTSLTWNIKGFLDDNPKSLSGKICDIDVICSIDDYVIEENDKFICCIGNSAVRKSVTEKMKARGAKFATIIHPNATIADSCTIGEGAIIYPYALISDNAVIGDGTIINMYSSVAHDSTLGEYCTISAHCDITGMCTLGDRVFMGTTSHMVPRTKIGNNAYICAGSTIMTRVMDGRKMMGCPARPIKF